MMLRLLAVTIACSMAGPLVAQENVVPNADFSAGLEGWTVSRAETQPAIDTAIYRSAPAALRIPATAERVGVKTERIDFAQPLPNALGATVHLLAENVTAQARIGLDIHVIFDNGSDTWFFPESLILRPEHAGTWTRRSGTYVAPPGRRIAAIEVFCLNYYSEDTAWFDDVVVRPQTAAEAEHDVAILHSGDPTTAAVTDTSAALEAVGIEHDIVPATTPLEAFRLVIVPEWLEDERLYLALKVAHYLGGRVILCRLPDDYYANALARYFFDRPVASLPPGPQVSNDGRAAHLGERANTAAVARALLGTELRLPDEVPAIDCGPKAPYTIRDGALYVGDEPLLFRAMGTYRVNGETPVEVHRANFAHYARLRLNGLVLYLSYATPVDHLRRVLDAVWEEGLRAMIWLHGPSVRSYSEKPLKDEWLLRFLPLREHPAMLAWIITDDTWTRHLPFVSRTAEVIRRYDDSNLVTTTLMDLRKPERVSEEGWARWRETLDFPLTYLYPLQKGRTFGGGEDIEGGLEDVQRLAEHTRQVWGEPVYLQQWCQAHMQGHAFRKIGLSGLSTFVPTAEQQRLLTCMMLSAGTRGILYFSSYGLADDRLGMGRRAELGLLWGELEPVQDIVAAGEITSCATSDPSVEAVVFTRGGESVVMAIKHGAEYNRYVDDAVVTNLRVELPSAAVEGAVCLRLDGPEAREIAIEGSSITIPEMDTACALLVTSDDLRVARVRAHREAWAPLAARLALTVAADRWAKTHVIAERIEPLTDDEFRALLAEGDALFDEARTHLAANDAQATWHSARMALRPWRRAQARAIRAGEAAHDRLGLDESELILVNIYPALPIFVAQHMGGKQYQPGEMREEVLSSLSMVEGLTREPSAGAAQ